MLMRSTLMVLAVALCLITGGVPQARAGIVIHGAGGTFPYPIYAWWALRYGRQSGTKILYDAIGSGGGIERIESRAVDFGASDAPLTPAELQKYGLIQFPTVLGGVVPAINVPGVPFGQLKLTGPVLAEIFLGRITRWNDPMLRVLNPTMDLPDLPITVVHRTKGSGTTWIFTNYLSKVSPAWRRSLGNHKLIDWPVGVAAIGNGGIIDKVNATSGAIGYCEYSYAVESHVNYAMMQNHDGVFVKPGRANFQAAADGVDWSRKDADIVLTDKPGPTTWPIAGATFILMYKQQAHPEVAREILRFFDWCYREGGLYAELIDYVTLSDDLVNNIHQTWRDNLIGTDGELLWK
jgi:phosphate transport system substrate-binding protein